MFLENDIVTNETIYLGKVDSNGWVHLPKYCNVMENEQFVLVANDENSAYIVNLNELNQMISNLREKLSKNISDNSKRIFEKELDEIYSSIILKTDVCELSSKLDISSINESDKNKYGINLKHIAEFLDNKDSLYSPYVVFQNVNGKLLMYYGIEAFKKGTSENSKKRR